MVYYIVVIGFVILVHVSDSSNFGLQSLFTCVAGRRSILCGVFSSPHLPFLLPLVSTIYQCDRCLSSWGCGANGWVVRFCQPSVQSPS